MKKVKWDNLPYKANKFYWGYALAFGTVPKRWNSLQWKGCFYLELWERTKIKIEKDEMKNSGS